MFLAMSFRKDVPLPTNKRFTQLGLQNFLIENQQTSRGSEDRRIWSKTTSADKNNDISPLPSHGFSRAYKLALKLEWESIIIKPCSWYSLPMLHAPAPRANSPLTSPRPGEAPMLGHSKPVCPATGCPQLEKRTRGADVTTACHLLPKVNHLGEPTAVQHFSSHQGAQENLKWKTIHRIRCPATKWERTSRCRGRTPRRQPKTWAVALTSLARGCHPTRKDTRPPFPQPVQLSWATSLQEQVESHQFFGARPHRAPPPPGLSTARAHISHPPLTPQKRLVTRTAVRTLTVRRFIIHAWPS